MNEANQAELELLDLPNECLMNIIQHIDYSSRQHVALVSQRFYDIVSNFDQGRNLLALTSEDVSVINSEMNFSFIS